MRYTNVMLTIIALCLIVLAARDLRIIPEASAQTAQEKAPVHVIISGVDMNQAHAVPVTNPTYEGRVLNLHTYSGP